MNRVDWGRRLMLLVAIVGVLSPGSSARAGEEERDDLMARKRASADVEKLISQAKGKLQRCVDLFVEQESYSLIEVEGRDAKNLYRQILELEPNNSYASLSIGYVDLILGRSAGADRKRRENHYSAAMSRFREALERRPGYADAYLYMAQVQALQGEYGEAEEHLRLILSSGIEDSQVHSWMAYVQFKQKRRGEAAQHIARGIELDNPPASARWSRENQGTVER